MATCSSILPGESHGQRSLEGCSPWGRKESDTTEVTAHTFLLISDIMNVFPYTVFTRIYFSSPVTLAGSAIYGPQIIYLKLLKLIWEKCIVLT